MAYFICFQVVRKIIDNFLDTLDIGGEFFPAFLFYAPFFENSTCLAGQKEQCCERILFAKHEQCFG